MTSKRPSPDKISKAIYQHSLNRLQTMIRGAVVGLIHRTSLDQPYSGYGDARAMTLMSTDTNGVCQSARFFHETWAQIIEVVVGITMLGREVGWLCPVPLVIIFCWFTPKHATFAHSITDLHESLFQNESLRGQEPPEQAKGLERSYAKAPCHDELPAQFHEKSENVGSHSLY